MWDYQRAFELHPRLQDSTVKWLPAHKTFQEAVEGGMSYEDWSGNGMADCFAKWAAKELGDHRPSWLTSAQAEGPKMKWFSRPRERFFCRGSKPGHAPRRMRR